MKCKITGKNFADRYMIKHDGVYIPFSLYCYASQEIKKSVITIEEIKDEYERLINYEDILIRIGRLLRIRARKKMLLKYSEITSKEYPELNETIKEEVTGFRNSLRYWALTERNKDVSTITRKEFMEFSMLLLNSDAVEEESVNVSDTTETVRKYIRDWLEKGINSIEKRSLVYEIL